MVLSAVCISTGAIIAALRAGMFDKFIIRMQYRKLSSPKNMASTGEIEMEHGSNKLLNEDKLRRLEQIRQNYSNLSSVRPVTRRSRQDIDEDTKRIISEISKYKNKSTKKTGSDWYFEKPAHSWDIQRPKND